LPVQLTGNLSGYQFFLQKNFLIKHFHFDNEVMYQSYNIDSVVSFPPLVIRSGVYYQNMIFKKAMLGKVGADVNYTSGYFFPGYIGETGQFTVQQSSNEKFNPTVDAFVSVRVRAVRAYVMFQNVFNAGSFSAFPYPMPDRSFKVGFEWMFWD
jgi:hypothetical protein